MMIKAIEKTDPRVGGDEERIDKNSMEDYIKEYTRWQEQPLPEELAEELRQIRENEEEIYDRFCRTIAFGTSGLRGKMGAGTNRMNTVILRKTTRAISRYLTERYETPVMVVGFDTRRHSEEYARTTAKTFAENGVSVYLASEPIPVPVISFAVRHLGINGGVMITASHNTKEYNGYKVYDHYGNQIDDKKALLMERYMEREETFSPNDTQDLTDKEKAGTISFLGDDVKAAYLQALRENTPWWDSPEHCREALGTLRVCYTPLNGTGINYVLPALEQLGIRHLQTVRTQEAPDGTFPTCPSPNPEYPESFEEALKTCRDTGPEEKPDLILATDPDSDRLGVMVRCGQTYRHLSGNQTGELLFDYVCRVHGAGIRGRNLCGREVMIKSIVSSPLTEDIAGACGVQVKNVFTGFKNIAAEMEKLLRTDGEKRFLFGFEESLGYLYADYTRDKDGIMAAQLVCLAAAQLKAEGKTLTDRLEEIYQRYGYLASRTFSVYYRKENERRKIQEQMQKLFSDGLKRDGFPVKKELCYRTPPLYCADLTDGTRIIVRPSGTEPKLKTYIFSRGRSAQEAETAADSCCSRMQKKWKEEGIL